MHRITLFITILLFTGFTLGCKSKYDPNDPLIGVWVFDKSEYDSGDTFLSFRRADRFEQSNSGYEFKNNGLLISRQIDGWCATPPASYVDSKGDWLKKDKTLHLKVNIWSGLNKTEYVISMLTESTLRLKRVN